MSIIQKPVHRQTLPSNDILIFQAYVQCLNSYVIRFILPLQFYLFIFFLLFGYSLGSRRRSRKNLTLTYAECVSLSARLFRVTCIKPSGEKKQDSFYFKLVFKLQRAWVSVTVWHNSGRIFFWNWIQQGEEIELVYLNGRQMLLLFVDKDKYLSRALCVFFSNNRKLKISVDWDIHSKLKGQGKNITLSIQLVRTPLCKNT